MKKDIHPEYVETRVTCTCENSLTIRSTSTSSEIRVNVCSACYPFCTGKQKILDIAGRVNCFETHYAKYNMVKKVAAEKKVVKAKKAASEATAVK